MCVNLSLKDIYREPPPLRTILTSFRISHASKPTSNILHSAASSGATDSNVQVFSCAEFMDRDLEATQSEHMSSVSNVPLFAKEADSEPLPLQTCSESSYCFFLH